MTDDNDTQILNRVKRTSITSIISENKHNDVLKYLIILNKEDYKPLLLSKSLYEKIMIKKKLFNGKLYIENIDFFHNLGSPCEDQVEISEEPNCNADNINSNYLIDGNIIPRIIYVRLPKEKIYVPIEVFQERLLDSKLNELITIFSTLQAKKIDISVIHEQAEKININLGAGVGVNVYGYDVNVDASIDNTNKINKKNSTTRTMTFQNPDKNIDSEFNMNVFGDYSQFFYLPKEFSWTNIIKRRINQKQLQDTYTYSYNDYNCISKELITHLKIMQFQFKYDTKRFENLKIEYVVDYFPFSNHNSNHNSNLEDNKVNIEDEDAYEDTYENENEVNIENENENEDKYIYNKNYNAYDIFSNPIDFLSNLGKRIWE